MAAKNPPRACQSESNAILLFYTPIYSHLSFPPSFLLWLWTDSSYLLSFYWSHRGLETFAQNTFSSDVHIIFSFSHLSFFFSNGIHSVVFSLAILIKYTMPPFPSPAFSPFLALFFSIALTSSKFTCLFCIVCLPYMVKSLKIFFLSVLCMSVLPVPGPVPSPW